MKVSGRLFDDFGGLEGSHIVLIRDGESTTLATVSNQNGFFALESDEIKPNDKFKISFVGKKDVIRNAQTLQDAKIFMEDNIEELDEVVITNKTPFNATTFLEDMLTNVGNKPNRPNEKPKWYQSKVFVISLIGIATLGTIFYIVKKTR